MIGFYLKLAWRKLKADKIITLGRIASIVFGILCVTFILAWIRNELNTDRFHKKTDNIYLTVVKSSPMSNWKPLEIDRFFKFDYQEYPHVTNKLTLKKYDQTEAKLKIDVKTFKAEGLIADSTFFDFFDFKLLTGDREKIMKDPTSIVITEQLARKMFGESDALGKSILVECGRKGTYQVAGILERVPSNSSITFDFIVPRHSQNFWSRSGANFILTDDYFNESDFKKKIADIGKKHDQFKESTVSIIPLKQIYFNHRLERIFSKHGDKRTIIVLSLIAAIILIISFLNFTNLQTIQLISGIKSSGIKKVNGASKKNLLYHLFAENIIIIFISVCTIIVLYKILLPWSNQFLKTDLTFHFLNDLLGVFIITGIFTILSFIYPFIQLSKILPYEALQNKLLMGTAVIARKMVTTLQYTLTLLLLIASMVVFRQLHFMLNKDLGFQYSNTVKIKFFGRIPFRPWEDQFLNEQNKQIENWQFLKNEIRNNPNINYLCQGDSPLGVYKMSWKKMGENQEYTTVNILIVNPGWEKLFGLHMKEGRFFNDTIDRSREHKVVINEAAQKYWQIQNIEKNTLASTSWGENYQIIGVLKDFNYQHLSVKIQPLVILYFEDRDREFMMQLREKTKQSSIKFLAALFNKINPEETFEYSFIEDEIRSLYQKEKKISKICMILTIIALFISSIGLFTFALYDTKVRTKEIGIRKVNGAKVSNIMQMLNYDSVKWVVIAFVIACPVAYYAMSRWLENFAYKTGLSWWIFTLAGLMALVIALLTVSWQSYRVATRNPVEALRYE